MPAPHFPEILASDELSEQGKHFQPYSGHFSSPFYFFSPQVVLIEFKPRGETFESTRNFIKKSLFKARAER